MHVIVWRSTPLLDCLDLRLGQKFNLSGLFFYLLSFCFYTKFLRIGYLVRNTKYVIVIKRQI